MEFVKQLEQTLRAHAVAETAAPMSAYMKNRFAFLGIKNEKRKALLKPVLAAYPNEIKDDFRRIVLDLWQLAEREYHYCAMEILYTQTRRTFLEDDIALIERLLTDKSWWDSVDFLAKHVLGGYLLAFPLQIPSVVKRFSASPNMWLNRSAILFQLGYKENTDAGLLFSLCSAHSQSTEFFIRKAIGWALREYAKTDPEAVRQFVSRAGLSPLSRREALKNL